MPIAPDTAQNIRVMFDLIFLHNFQAIIYALGILVAVFLSIYKPSRAVVFMLLGFLCLLFAFEYKKHIMEPLIAQTLGSLVTERQSPTVERFIHILLRRLLPLGLPILGWILVGLGIKKGALNLKKEEPNVQIIHADTNIKYSLTPQQKKLLNHMVESVYQFKNNDIPLSRLLGKLEGTLRAGDFDKSINFDEWYKQIGKLEIHSKEKSDSISYEEIKEDIDTMEQFLTEILQHSKVKNLTYPNLFDKIVNSSFKKRVEL